MTPRSFGLARLAALLLCLLPLVASAAALVKVVRVIDGDTVELETGENVRYIGIDAPETVHPQKSVEFMGKDAAEANRRLVLNKRVRLEFDVEKKDRYGRLLAYVYVDSLFVNAELVLHGFAQVLTIPPNVRHAEEFLALGQVARDAKRGLWDEKASATWVSSVPQTDVSKYYITNTGKKYHQGGCRYLSKSAIEIKKEDAVARGYGSCSVCVASSLTPSKESSPAGGRCAAITNQGARCKRNANAGNRYCWQHGG